MSRRSLSWSTALRDIRADRIQLPPQERKARCRQRAFARLAAQRASAIIRSRPLVTAGAYNRRAIMCMAIAAAKARRAITGEAWSLCISAALTGTWQAAKAARLWATLREQGRFERAQEPVRRSNLSVVREAEGEGRAFQSGDLSPSQTSRLRPGPGALRMPGTVASLIPASR